MAIYKPNNFYPYMQEVDLESEEGVVFSCQANTDGNSVVKAARLRILDKDENIVLYEKIQNLDKPVKNGEIVEFKVEPYNLQWENSSINFVTLSPDISIDNRKSYCPYNIYNEQIYNLDFFNLINRSYGVAINNYNIEIKDNAYYFSSEEISSKNVIYITLKNNKDYIWDIELFEDTINTDDYAGTFVSVGRIVGTTKNTIWIDKNEQVIEIYKNLDKIDDEKYVEYNLSEFNSDIYKDKLNEGFTLSGELSLEKNEINEEIFSSWQNKNFYSERGIVNATVISNYNAYTPDDLLVVYRKEGTGYLQGITLMCNNNFLKTKDLLFGDIYEYNDNGQRVLKDNFKLIQFDKNFNTKYRSDDNTYSSYSPYPRIATKQFSTDKIFTSDEVLKKFISYQWREVYNVEINIENNSFQLNFNNSYVGNSLNDCCFRIGSWNSDYISHPITTKNAATTVVANDEELSLSDSDLIELKTCKEDNTLSMNAFLWEEVHKINGKLYRTRVLTPLPYSPSWCSTVDGYDGGYWDFSSNNSPNDILTEMNTSFYSTYDYDCYINKNPNCLEGMFFKQLINSNFDTNVSNNSSLEFNLKLNETNTQIFKLNPRISYDLKITISDNALLGEDLTINIVETNGNILTENILIDKFKKDVNENTWICEFYVSDSFINPELQIDFIDYESIQNVELSESSVNNEYVIKIQDTTIKKLNINDLFLNVSLFPITNTNNNIDSYKIKNIINNNIFLENENIQRDLILKILNGNKIYYFLSYKDRISVSWVIDDLGKEQNILKIELKDEIPYNLKNLSEVNLYECTDDFTYNSFFGVKNSNLNVDNLYVRFPGYTGCDINGEKINDIIPYYNHCDYLNMDNTGVIAYIAALNINSKPYYFDYNHNLIHGSKTEGLQGCFFNNDTSTYYNRGKNEIGEFFYYSLSPQSEDEDFGFSKLGYQPIDIYGKNVRAEIFDKQTLSMNEKDNKYNVYCKLFKVTSYNYETGEIIFAGGLERKLERSDKYELWEANVIEGSSNEYDITEVIKTYSRLYPESTNKDAIAYVGGESIFNSPIRIFSNSNDYFFIQPNNNILFSEYNEPYLKLLKNNDKINFTYSYEREFFTIDNNTIDKLDDSQWLINNNSQYNFNVGDKYEIYQDSVISNTNYFYGRDNEELNLYIIPKNKFNGDISTTYPMRSTINFMDFYIGGIYGHTEPLKKYILKIYDSNMNLIYNSTEVYDSKILYRVKGLNNNQSYYMTIECENQLGNITIYEQDFTIQYNEKISENIFLNVKNDCEKSRVLISFVNQNNENCFLYDFQKDNSSITNTSIIDIYRKDYNGNIEWIYDINLEEDMAHYDYSYAFYDYNVRNNEKYEYFAVLKIVADNIYTFAKGEIITNFDCWFICDIIEDEDGLYTTVGDIWSFKYNLESEDLVQNTSVTIWDTLGRYGQVGKGEKNYLSSGMRCLLGDIGYYSIHNNSKTIKRFGYNEKDNSINNITKYKKWRAFCNSFNKKLLKDIKGNKWIVQIVENPNAHNDDKSNEQLYTIAFNWNEIEDSDLISICNTYESSLIPSDGSLFTFTYNNTNKTAKIKAKSTDLSGDIVIPYCIDFDGMEYKITEIDTSAFANCTSLTSIKIPNSVSIINPKAFANCTSLTSIKIPNSVRGMNISVFNGCNSLTEITIPFVGISRTANRTYASVFGFIFGYSNSFIENTTEQLYSSTGTVGYYYIPRSLKKVTITDAEQIQYGAFSNCENLETIVLNDGITGINDYAFSGCSSLKNIIIPNTVTTIGEGSFNECSALTNIKVPNNVETINSYAFYGCNSLIEITLPFIGSSRTANGTFDAVFGYIFGNVDIDDEYTTKQQYSSGRVAYYYIPRSLKKVIITDETQIPSGAFYNCENLESIVLNDNVISIDYYAFYNCSNLKNIIIPNHLSSIGGYVYYGCSSLTKIVIPQNVEKILNNAFQGCSSLRSIIIPLKCINIGSAAFYNCKILESVYYEGTEDNWNNIVIQGGSNNNSLKNATRYYNYEY